MRPVDNIEKLIKKLRYKASAQAHDRILDNVMQALEKKEKQKPAAVEPDIWRKIMKSPVTKLAAAAAIIIAAGIFLYTANNMVPAVYALQDTIEAYNSIGSLHIKESETIGQETRTSETWIECDMYGNINRIRFQTPYCGEPVGSLTIVGNHDQSQAWLAKHNLYLVGYGNPSGVMGLDVSQIEPKGLVERLYQQQELGEIVLDINEPMQKNKPILVTVTYPQGSKSEKWKKVFHIDQATKLVTRIDKFEWRSQGFEHIKTLEFFDYNQQIDPMMFTLEGDVPDDAQVVDMSEMEAGLPQDDMTDQEIAEKVTREFFEALIDKDFYRAGQLYLGAPDFLVEQAFMGANVLKIISIGPGHREPDPDSNAMNCSCKFLAEFGGLYYEVNAWMVRIIRADRDANRWLICGMAISTRPAPGIITLSRDRADPSAVTYDGLRPGEFMKKWLILEPIRIEERKYVHSVRPSEETQKDKFATEQVDVSNFQAKVNVSGEDHEWSVLENKYGIIDLTDEFGEWPLITYAWAQIEMSEEKQVVLGIGSDDGVKVWLNGELVHENWVCRGVGVDDDRVPVTFKKGTNQLVLKIQNQGGPWGFCCRLLDE